MDQFPYERRADMGLISEKILTLHSDVSDVKHSIKELTSAINKLAVVEERLSHSNQMLDGLFKHQAKIDERLERLEKQALASEGSAKWIDRTLVGLLGAFLVFIWERVIK